MRVNTYGAIEHPEDKNEGIGRVVSKGFYAFWKITQTIIQAINGNLTFGTGVSAPDNIAGKWITYTTNGVANTEDAIEHNMGVIPTGSLVMIPPESGVINRGSTPWTTTHIYLKCTAASQTAKIFLTSPPRTS